MTAETLRRWAENLCRVKSTARNELAAAIEGNDETKLPPGVTRIELDEREISPSGIRLRFAPSAISRRQFEQVFGRGEALVRVAARAPVKYMTTVEAPRAPYRCTVIAEYRTDLEIADLRGLYLRIDRPRAACLPDPLMSGGTSRRGGRIGTGGVTELHRAAWAGEVEEVRRRLAAGDAVDSADAAGFTPLGAAAAAGRAGAVAELLAEGADPNRPALDGCTPLFAAVGGGHREIVRVLLAAGADGNAIVDYNHTAVRRAAWRVDWPTLSVLLEGGVQLGLFDAALYVLRSLLATGAQVVLAEYGSSTQSMYHYDDPPHIKPDVFAVTGALALPADTPPRVRAAVRVEKDLLAFDDSSDDYVHFVGPRTQIAGGLRGCFLKLVEWPAYAERLSALLHGRPPGPKELDELMQWAAELGHDVLGHDEAVAALIELGAAPRSRRRRTLP